MCGEWQFGRDIAWAFGTFHRLYSICHSVVRSEYMAGTGALMAEYNGLDKYPHIQEKLAWLAMYAERTDVISKAACAYPDMDPDTGLAVPNLMYTNVTKYQFANDRDQACKHIADITGGLVATVPCYRDWMNPEERPFIEKYLAAKAGIPTEHRLKAIRLAKDITSYGYGGIHSEGSLMAQRMAMYSAGDWKRYKAAAKRVARIPGWDEHPTFKDLPEFPPNIL